MGSRQKISRAERRHHLERVKESMRNRPYWEFLRDDPRMVGMLANTRTMCSKRCCGNKRKREGPPVSERRRMDSAKLTDERQTAYPITADALGNRRVILIWE